MQWKYCGFSKVHACSYVVGPDPGSAYSSVSGSVFSLKVRTGSDLLNMCNGNTLAIAKYTHVVMMWVRIQVPLIYQDPDPFFP